MAHVWEHRFVDRLDLRRGTEITEVFDVLMVNAVAVHPSADP